jgi:hypothetical protein
LLLYISCFSMALPGEIGAFVVVLQPHWKTANSKLARGHISDCILQVLWAGTRLSVTETKPKADTDSSDMWTREC